VLDSTIKIINYIKSGSINTCLFKEFCRHDFDTRVFLFHTSVRWLPKVNILNRVFVLKDEIKLFSEMKANELLSYVSDKI